MYVSIGLSSFWSPYCEAVQLKSLLTALFSLIQSQPPTPLSESSMPAGSEGDAGPPPTDAPPAQGEEEASPYDTAAFDWGKYTISFFARNFHNFKMAALVMAFVINFLLLFYRVSVIIVLQFHL